MSFKINNIKIPILYIVIPCYNEEKVLPITAPLFKNKILELIGLNKIDKDSKVLFINDGSKDNTWNFIKKLSLENDIYQGVSLSCNRGHQNALLAGLMYSRDKCDVTISIDCDGQDDMNAMNAMIDEYLQGSEVVYGVRSKRDTDTFFKRFTAESFYKLLNLMGARVIFNHADYRLASSRVLKEFSNFKEVNIYLRGMFPMIGFKSTCVYYERNERIAGESHYPLKKMISLAFDGITSLSIKPIRIITSFGIFISFLSFIIIIWVLISYFMDNVVPGWSSSLLCSCLLGGIQLTSLGVVGEYIGKIYLETKNRPRFIIEESTTKDGENL